MARSLGPKARAGTPREAAVFGDIVLISVPYGALPQIGKDLQNELKGKVVLDTGNPYPERDGEMAVEARRKGTGVASAEFLPGVRLARAFNAISYRNLRSEAHRTGERVGIPIAADDPRALDVAARQIHVEVDVGIGGDLFIEVEQVVFPRGERRHVAVPRDVPPVNLVEMRVSGADVLLVDGLIDEAGRVLHERAARAGWFELNTLKEPYRQEGKKTLGIELAEQGGWGDDCLPDVIVFPTGGGTGIVGMWKAFAELGELGWIGRKRPKMVVVQSTGCAPLVRAFEQGADHADPWKDAATIAAGIRVPSAIGDYLVLKAIRESGGTAIAVTDDEIRKGQIAMARETGVYTSPEGAATWAALGSLRQSAFLTGEEDVILFSTGAGVKYEPPL